MNKNNWLSGAYPWLVKELRALASEDYHVPGGSLEAWERGYIDFPSEVSSEIWQIKEDYEEIFRVHTFKDFPDWSYRDDGCVSMYYFGQACVDAGILWLG